jgi:predicted O-methyltransferase YrrM
MTDQVVDALDNLEPLPQQVRKASAGIQGWLTMSERQALHTLGRLAPGPLLEVGPWLGLSTVYLAHGASTRADGCKLTTVEINPTIDQFAYIDGTWMFQPDPDEPPVWMMPDAEWPPIEAAITNRHGVEGLLKRNLRRAKVSSLVDIVIGDVRDVDLEGPFGCVFSDTMHNPDEIARYAPRFRSLVADGGVFACHDSTPENRLALKEVFEFSDERLIDSLFVGVVAETADVITHDTLISDDDRLHDEPQSLHYESGDTPLSY